MTDEGITFTTQNRTSDLILNLCEVICVYHTKQKMEGEIQQNS
jgi:hypothetical protein